MDLSEHEEASVTLGISIPVDSSKIRETLREREDAINQQPDVLSKQLEFSNLVHSLDPNLGIMGQLPSADIDHEKGTFNPWNIEPHYLNILPQYTSNSNENYILVVGGLNPSSVLENIPSDLDVDDFVLGSTIFQYILDSGIWNYYGTMIEPRCYHACALDGQYLYITGGYSILKRKHGEMIAISSTDRLNLIDKKWKSCADMVMSRAAHALVAHKKKLYVFGGRNSQGSILASVEMYDPHQDLWFEIASLPRPTMGLSATCIMDSVWLIGGITNNTSENPAECLSSSVFSFIPSVKKWYVEVPLPHACAFSSCISNDYALWLIGGCTVSRNPKEKSLISCSSVLKLSLSKKCKWKPVASLLYPRHALTAVLHDENIYVLGGIESSSKCASDKAEVINIIENVSVMCSRMPAAIAGCTSILIVPEKDDCTYIEEASDASSTFSEGIYNKTGVEDYYYGESSRTSSALEDVYDVNRKKYLPPMSPINQLHGENLKETFPRKNEKNGIPVTHENSTFSERKSFKTGVEDYYSDENSKTSSTLEDVYDLNRNNYLPPMSPINQLHDEKLKETFPKATEKNVIPVTQESSTLSERENLKTVAGNYYSGESSKTPSTLEDIYNVNKNKCLSPIPAVHQLHGENFKEPFPEKAKDIEIPITQESFKEKDLVTSKVNELKAKRSKKIRYRTSMEIFLDSNVIGLCSFKKEPSPTSKWLDYFKKFQLSDEKLHKEIFHSKEPKLHVKTEVVNTKVNLKSPDMQYFGKDGKLDLLSSTSVQSFLPSLPKPSIYANLNVKDKLPDVNEDQNFENRKKTTSEDTVISEITDLKWDNLHNDAPDEIKIIINEDKFPVILLIGGEYSKKPDESRFILTYYCKEDVWNYAGKLPEYRNHHSAVFVNNKIYIIGGFRSENSKFRENITNKTMYFDICDKLWHDTASIIHPRAHHSAVVLKDKIYVLGGRDQSGQILSSVEVYDESYSNWKECESLPYPVLGAAAFSLDDSIHIFGGITYEEDNEIISVNTAIFDTKKNSWTADFEMPLPLAFCGIANDSNSVWLFGGLTFEENNPVSSKDIYKSDIFTKTWTKVLELSTPRLAPVTVFIEEKVYVIGGHSFFPQEKKEVLTCELIDLAKNEVFLLKNLPIGITGRAGVAVTEKCKTERK